MKQTKQQQAQTIQSILESALILFDEFGYEGISLDKIAKKSGVSRGAIYHNFSGKDDILYQLIQQRNNDITAEIEKLFSTKNSSQKNIMMFFEIYFSYLVIDCRLEKLLFFSNFQGKEKEMVEKINIAEQKELEEYFSYLFKIGIKQGEFSKDYRHQDLSKILYSNLIGILYTFFQAGKDEKPRFIEHLEIFFQGILINK